VVTVLVVTIEELDCPRFSHELSNAVVFEFNVWRKPRKIRAGSDLR